MKIEEILRLAKEKDASDIHIVSDSPLMFRIHGELIPQSKGVIKPMEADRMLRAVMTPEQVKSLEQTGELEFAFSIPGFSRVRINIFSQCGTYAASLRILSYEVPKAENLGIPGNVIELTKRKQGLVLVTGTAGSGKSTTLASLIGMIAERDCKNIITLEDPIEYLHSYKRAIVSQREIGRDTHSYADALRAAMRQDPDVIMVGELRDMETILVALEAAETGHLVFSMLHMGCAADAINRIIDVFPSYQQQQVRVQLASVLEGVVAQQLLPCTDVNGRMAAFEVLIANANARNLIREGKTHQISKLIQNSKRDGMQAMDDAILDAYMKSRIDMETAISYAQDPESMCQKVRIF